MTRSRAEERRYQTLYAQLCPAHKIPFAGTLLRRAACHWPDRLALLCGTRSLTYQELYARALLVTHLLNERVQPRDRVLIFYENSLEFFIAYYGAWQRGAVVVPLNVFLHPHELEHIIRDAKPTAILVSEQLREKISPDFTHLIIDIKPATADYFEQKAGSYAIPEFDPDEMAALLYTSGTTGLPKGVMLSSRNIIINCIQGTALFEVEEHDRAFAALPLFHSYMQNTCVWSSFAVGATTIVVPKIDRKSLKEGLAHKPTIVLGIPSLYGLLTIIKGISFNSVRYCISGGEALPDKIRMIFALRYRRKICNGYGLTETSPFVAGDLEDVTEPTNTVGYPLIGVEYSLRTETGQEVPAGQIGVLWVKGDNVMLGYYNAPEATAKVLQNGWLNTGDLARISAHGKLVICGREKDLIINKGIKIYPQEVENILLSYANVIQAAVIGIAKDNEEYAVAYVGVTGDIPENLQAELKMLCQNHLAAYKVPRQIIVQKKLPVTATGKVDKKVLKKQFEEDQIK
jgi:long-chain acyl-CoA synthetase